MQRSKNLFALAALCATLAGCADPEPRPFSTRGRSLDQPPRYGEANRFVQPVPGAPGPRQMVDPDIDPRTVPPGVNLTPPPGLGGGVIVDPGLTATPPGAGATTTVPPVTTTTPTTPPPTGATTTATPPPAAGDAPYARAVPGKPGFVYSPHEQGKILDVTGLRPGTKVKDPQTGAMFRVP